MSGFEGLIEWAYTPRTSRFLRVLVYVPFAVFGGVLVLGTCLIGWLVAAALVRGDLERAVLVAVGAIVGGLFFLRGPPAVLFMPDERERLASEFEVPLRPRRLLVASAIGAAVLLLSVRVASWVAAAVFVGGMATLVVVSVLRSKGAIDPEELTLEDDLRSVSLAALRGVRSITIGSLTVCWLSFERGSVGARAPRVIVLPADTYRRARPVFDRGIEIAADAGRTAPPAERVVFLVFGLGLLAVGPVFWTFTPSDSDATVFVLLAGAMTDVFGLLFVWFAVVS